MGRTPLVSIIIPCYNAEGSICEAIESALRQGYPDKEIIVIDDGSTDGSLDVIRSFGSRIVWEAGPNRGGSAARNRGLALANGELIQFLDADDLIDPAKLERMVPLASKNGPWLTTICDWTAIDVRGLPNRHKIGYSGEDPVVYILRLCWSRQNLPISSPLHWKMALERVGGFREELPNCQEFDLHLRLAFHGVGFVHIPESLVTVRRRSGSVSADYLRILDQLIGVYRGLYVSLKIAGALTSERRFALALACVHSAIALVRRGRPARAGKYFAYAVKLILSERLFTHVGKR